MPRLSVDIDLTYIEIAGRKETLDAINVALGRIKKNIEKLRPSIRITITGVACMLLKLAFLPASRRIAELCCQQEVTDHGLWDEACKSCSWADTYNAYYRHLNQRDVTLVAVSRAPLAKLQAFAQRMDWRFPWYSSEGSDFNYDFGVSFTDEQIASGSVDYNFRMTQFTPQKPPGISVFYRDDQNQVFRTYSCYARGLDMLNGACHHLDLVPKGRDETELPYSMAWLNFQDSYD